MRRAVKLKKQVVTSRIWSSVFRSRKIRVLGSLLAVLIVLVMIISAVEVRVNDNLRALGDVFYWAVITITTVGYGDITPQTELGQFLTIILILIGVVLVSFFTATIASIMTATRIREGKGLERIDSHDHIVICGYNHNIGRVIEDIRNSASSVTPEITLINAHHETEITDLTEHFPELVIRFVSGDYTLEGTLRRAAISNASAAIILADAGHDGGKADDRTLLASLAIKSIAEDVRVCVEILDAGNEIHLRRAGVDFIVLSAEFNGFLLANSVMSPGLPQAVRDIMLASEGGYLTRQPFPKEIVGRTFLIAAGEAMGRTGSVLVGVITEKRSFNLGTILSNEEGAIDDFIRRKFDEAGRSLEIESRGRLSVRVNPGPDYIITEDDLAVVITPHREQPTV